MRLLFDFYRNIFTSADFKKSRIKFLLLIILSTISAITDFFLVKLATVFIDNYSKSIIDNESIFFLISIIISSVTKMTVFKLIYTVTAEIITIIANLICKQFFEQPFPKANSISKSEFVSLLTNKLDIFGYSFIQSTLLIINSTISIIAVLISLIYIIGIYSLISILLIGIIYALIYLLLRKSVHQISFQVSKLSNEVTHLTIKLRENIRWFYFLDQKPPFKEFRNKTEENLRSYRGKSQFFSVVPRYGIEAITSILILLYLLIDQGNTLNLHSYSSAIFTAIFFAGLRVIPAAQGFFACVVTIKSSYSSALDILLNLKGSNCSKKHLSKNILHIEPSFYDSLFSIELKNIEFNSNNFQSKNPHAPPNFKVKNLRLHCGKVYLLNAPNGSGKTTFLDLITGLLVEDKGSIHIVAAKESSYPIITMRAITAYCGQHSSLFSGTVEQNISLGSSSVDKTRMRKCYEDFYLKDFLGEFDDGCKKMVLDNGDNFSGGQRQKILLSRIFYMRKALYVLDETFSAIDEYSEELILKKIRESYLANSILILVSHRKSTERFSDEIIDIRSYFSRDF